MCIRKIGKSRVETITLYMTNLDYFQLHVPSLALCGTGGGERES